MKEVEGFNKFRLEMSTDNAAFTMDPVQEIKSILADMIIGIIRYGAADYIERGEEISGQLRDTHGNVVGRWEFVPEEYEPKED